MLIKSLEIQGFKSFPDKTVLAFNQGITAVVGPNGSGKSNISDAVRWVLGEQSTKSLRGSKMEDVIFNGTESRKPQGYAEVSLCIDNTDRSLNFNGDEVKVTRRYYRSGDSEYKINGSSVRLRDINEMFMDTGMGRDGYSIISQGKIADIVSTRSEDRREVFEEAAGISKYRYRKNEAERRLKQAQENLDRLKDILSELERQVGPLGVQAEKAKKYLEYATEKKGIEISLWVQNISKLTEVLRAQDEKLGIVKNQYENAANASEEIEREVQAISDEMNAIILRIDAIRRESAEKAQFATQKDGEVAVLENDIHHLGVDIDRLRSERESSMANEQQIKQEISEKLDLAAKSDEKVAKLKEELANAADDMSRTLLELVSADSGIKQASDEIYALKDQSAKLQTEINGHVTAIAEIKRRISVAEEERANAKQRIAEFENEKKRFSDTLKENEDKLTALKNTIQGHQLLLENQRQRVAVRKDEEEKLHLDYEAQKRRTQLLSDMEKSFDGFAHSIKIVMQESERGAIQGIHGPVSRILQVKPEYAIAIETALGGAAQHIVCSNEGSAKHAIAMLKQRDAGRATFLPLTSVRGNVLNEKGLDDEFGFIGIATELVSCDAQYTDICRSLLGRIAVAEDLDSAIAIARKYSYKFRVVTLDGQVVNAGGSLTGGSLAKNAGLLSRRAEIDRSAKKEEALNQKLQLAISQHKTAKESLASAEAAFLATQSEMITVQEEKVRLQADLSRITELLENSAKNEETLKAEYEQAEARIAELDANIRTLSAQVDAVTTDITEKEKTRYELESKRYQLNERREKLINDNGSIQTDIVSAEKDAQALRDIAENLRLRIDNQKQYYDELVSRENECNEKIVQIRQQIEVCISEAKKLRDDVTNGETEINQCVDRKIQLETKSSQLHSAEKDRLQEKEKCAQEMVRLEEQRNASQKDYDIIIKNLWDEYELSLREAMEKAVPLDDYAQSQRRLLELRSKIRALGTVNLDAIDSYREVSERYEFMKEQVTDAENAREKLQDIISRLTVEMRRIFTERFEAINKAFSETFRELFGGGTGSLALDDPNDVLNSGIRITVQPQGKIITNVDSLSGGEKSLAAIALYFAISKVSPAPFCILDEIEASLDDVNVTRFAEYLRRMTSKTQYIAITHRRGTMEEADVLYGVTMQEKGVSKLLQMHMNEIESIGIQ